MIYLERIAPPPPLLLTRQEMAELKLQAIADVISACNIGERSRT